MTKNVEDALQNFQWNKCITDFLSHEPPTIAGVARGVGFKTEIWFKPRDKSCISQAMIQPG